METFVIASPEAHFEARLEQAARALCEARGIEPESMQPYDNGTMAYTRCPAWRIAAEEIRAARLMAQCVRYVG
jgi:hypothetical protein